MKKTKWRRATGEDTFHGYCMVVGGEDTPAVVSQVFHADGVHFQWYMSYGGKAVSSHNFFAEAKRAGERHHESEVKTAALEAAVGAVDLLDLRQVAALERVVRDRKIELQAQKKAYFDKKKARRKRRA